MKHTHLLAIGLGFSPGRAARGALASSTASPDRQLHGISDQLFRGYLLGGACLTAGNGTGKHPGVRCTLPTTTA